MRSAATKAIAMGRLPEESTPRLPETVFDSPLQQALHLLARLTESLEEAGDDEAAAAAMHVSHLLRSKHLHASRCTLALALSLALALTLTLTLTLALALALALTLTSIIDEIELGGVAAGDDVHGWLSSMQLVPREGEGAHEHAAAGRHSGHDEARHHSSARVISPRLLVSANESELLSLLEHGIGEWSFDALALHRLSDGHALSTSQP